MRACAVEGARSQVEGKEATNHRDKGKRAQVDTAESFI